MIASWLIVSPITSTTSDWPLPNVHRHLKHDEFLTESPLLASHPMPCYLLLGSTVRASPGGILAEPDGNTPDHVIYAVVLNDEDQYSVWDVQRSVPTGWREEGFRGSYDDCIAHIETAWTDMRPRSLREAIRDSS